MRFNKPQKDELTICIVGPELAGIQFAVKQGASDETIAKYRKMINDHLDVRFKEIKNQQ